MHYLIDTNILIYGLKNMGKVNANLQKYQKEPMSISVISYGELVFGARKSQQVQKNLQTVETIKNIFPIENIDSDVMDVFGELKAKLQKTGNPVDDMDLLIGSTAIANDMTLVTHNTKHFENMPGLKLVDWY